jgi:hypothetical protein
MHLSHAATWFGLQWSTTQRGKIFEPAFLFTPGLIRGVKRKVTVVDGFDLTPFVFLYVSATDDPITPQST